MARSGGAGQFIRTTSSESALAAFTLSFHYRNPGAPGGGSTARVVTLVNSSGLFDTAFFWDHPTSGRRAAAVHRESSGTELVAKWGSPTSATDNRFVIAVGGGNLTLTVNGTEVATTPAGAADLTDPMYLCLLGDAIRDAEYDAGGYVSEVALYSTALTAAQRASLSLGCSPLLVGTSSLLHYIPVIRDVYDLKGAALTTNGTTVQPHGRVIMPSMSALPGRRSAAQTLYRRALQIRGARKGFLFPAARLVGDERRRQIRRMGGYG